MYSRFLTLSTLTLAVTSQVQAQSFSLTYMQVVSNINEVTGLSSDTNNVAMGISITNFFTSAPKTIDGFRSIITAVTNDITSISNSQSAEPFVEEGQTAICGSFRQFVLVHQQLLATVIGKYGLLSTTPYTEPMAQVLRTLEGGVDTLAFDIINMVPTCADGAKRDADALGKTLKQAITTYSG